MTIFLRDMSHYDSNESLAGFVGTTHKATEGTSYVDGAYAARLNRYRAAGVRVLGSYHVLHTGNLAAQLDHWLSTLDALTPWWRGFPHWVMQVDAERWPADNVSPDTVKAFAKLLVSSGAPGWKVTYASRGQYGNGLSGIATPLWNAAYHSSTYPGDGAADWAPYSGQAPVLWQYTSTPFDKNAFRGSLDELLTLIGGDDMANIDQVDWDALRWRMDALLYNRALVAGGPTKGETNALHAAIASIPAAGAPTQDQVNAAVAAVMNDTQWLAKLGAAIGADMSKRLGNG